MEEYTDSKYLLRGLITGKIKVTDVSGTALEGICQQTKIPKNIFDAIMAKGDSGNNYNYLANNPNVPLEWFYPFLKDDEVCKHFKNCTREFTEKQFMEIYTKTRSWNKLRLISRGDAPLELLRSEIERNESYEQMLALARSPLLTPELAEKLYLKSVAVIKAIIVKDAKMLTPGILADLERRPNKEVNKALATRDDLDDKTINRLLDSHIDVRLALAGNSKLSWKVYEKLLGDPDDDVKITVLANCPLSIKKFREYGKAKSVRKRRAIFCNPYLPGEIRLKMGVEPAILAETRSYFGISNPTKTPNAPIEIKFLVNKGKYLGWGGAPKNEALANEVREWRFLKDKKNEFCIYSKEQEINRSACLDIVKYKTDFNLGSWWGWRKKGDELWVVRLNSDCSKEINFNNGNDNVVCLIDLPKSTDGWLGMWDLGERGVYGIGATPEKGNGFESFYWLCKAEDKELKRTIPMLPTIQAHYPALQPLNKGSWEVELVGSFIFRGGLFALWEKENETIGWTQESRADKIPEKRLLSRQDMTPNWILNSVIKELEEDFRKQVSKEIAL